MFDSPSLPLEGTQILLVTLVLHFSYSSILLSYYFNNYNIRENTHYVVLTKTLTPPHQSPPTLLNVTETPLIPRWYVLIYSDLL